MNDAEPISAEAPTAPCHDVPTQGVHVCPVCGIMTHGGRSQVKHEYLTVKLEGVGSSDGPTAFSIFITQLQERGYLNSAICIHANELSIRSNPSVLLDIERILKERRLMEDFSWARNLMQSIKRAMTQSRSYLVFHPNSDR